MKSTLSKFYTIETWTDNKILRKKSEKIKKIDEDLINFEKEYGIRIVLLPTHNKFHDRYIMIDYKTDNEKLFDCDSSSKDAGNKITTIMLVEKPVLYHSLIDELLAQKWIMTHQGQCDIF